MNDGVNLCWSKTTRALHLKSKRALQKEAVADGRERLSANHKASLYAEEVRVLALHQQAPWIVGEVAEPCVELSFAQQQLIVIATGEEETVAAVVSRPLCLLL